MSDSCTALAQMRTCMRAYLQVPRRSHSLRGITHCFAIEACTPQISQEIHNRLIVIQSARWHDESQYPDDTSQHPDDGLLTGSSYKSPRRASRRGDRDGRPPECTLADHRTGSRQTCSQPLEFIENKSRHESRHIFARPWKPKLNRN